MTHSLSQAMLTRAFANFPDLIQAHASDRGLRPALVQGKHSITYAELDILMDRIATGLQRDGVKPRQAVVIVSAASLHSVAIFLGALRAGCVPVPLAPSGTAQQTAAMVTDCGAPIAFVDRDTPLPDAQAGTRRVEIDDLESWLGAHPAMPARIATAPGDPFNIIYSSGTTGTPKGIVHSHGTRWTQTLGWAFARFEDAVTLVATPLYSNTTLTALIPTLAYGGTAVILGKFDAEEFLATAERERATHTMLVPVQYQRLMAVRGFERFDLSSFQLKMCTSAPFDAALKADVVRRWPGSLLEIYGMTEGGGICLLEAERYPGKLHTVGRPAPGSDIRIIDEHGKEVRPGDIGEVVGRSAFQMTGYHGRPQLTDAAAWLDAAGNRYIRHGDLGRFDEDGFLILAGRCKDMIISGGFNVYPADIEAVLLKHPNVSEAAVIGVPSDRWGEAPFAYFVPCNEGVEAQELVGWVNSRVGKTQRLCGAAALKELPRSAIGKVLKRDLRQQWPST